MFKDPRQISGQRNISYMRYSKERFTQIYRDLYGDAMHAGAHLDEHQHGGRKPCVQARRGARGDVKLDSYVAATQQLYTEIQ